MLKRADLVYLYDGSYEGLLTCIFECYEKKELPVDIKPQGADQMTLYQGRIIATDVEKAQRVKAGIRKKASPEVYSLVRLGYYTCHPEKERLILEFVGLGLEFGKKAAYMLTDDTVNALLKAVKAMTMESHQLKGFIRFSVQDGVMTSVIEPKNFVLPLLKSHFCDRYSNETFMIYDKTHKQALFYQPKKAAILPVEEFRQADGNPDELMVRSLWKLFYDTIAIKERYNPRCRMNHMQKRYWKHMTEMNEQNAIGQIAKKVNTGLTLRNNLCFKSKNLNKNNIDTKN